MTKIPSVELLAALTQSRNTAEREGFPGVVAQVQKYIDEVEKLGPGTLIVKAWEPSPSRLLYRQVKAALPGITDPEWNEALEEYEGLPITDITAEEMIFVIAANRATAKVRS